jgi:hypothetical protein
MTEADLGHYHIKRNITDTHLRMVQNRLFASTVSESCSFSNDIRRLKYRSINFQDSK